jgi:hypothetical protein
MKRTLLAVALALFPLIAAQAQNAPPAPKPQLFVIHEEIAKPSMLAQYESTTREFFKALSDGKVDPAVFSVNTFVTPDFHYIYLAPISSFAGMDKIASMFMTLPNAVGNDRWQDLMRRGGVTMESYSETVVMLRPDLSYMPATPRLKPEENKYFRLEFFYVIPGKEQDAEAIARDYAALFKQKNWPDGYHIYMALNGENLPLLVVSIPAKSRADYVAADDRLNATLGADIKPLQARALSITRKFELREAMARPDFVYPPPAATK